MLHELSKTFYLVAGVPFRKKSKWLEFFNKVHLWLAAYGMDFNYGSPTSIRNKSFCHKRVRLIFTVQEYGQKIRHLFQSTLTTSLGFNKT